MSVHSSLIWTWIGTLALTLAAGCGANQITEAEIRAARDNADLGDASSRTLASKAWQASSDEDYPALFAYARECVQRYGRQGKAMNASMTDFAPPATAAAKWALNDVGTCLFIMAHAYADVGMYREASRSFRSLADGYSFAQCWDPKGWFWRPAEGARAKALQYQQLSRAGR